MKNKTSAIGIIADKIEHWSVDDLIPYARNAKKHSVEQVAQIAASMKEFGFTIPVLVADDGTIIAGHGRVMAATEIGLETVPVIVAHGWSDEQRRAYTLADNKLSENAEWDDDLLKIELAELGELDFDTGLIGFSVSELTKLLGEPTDENDPKKEWDGMPEFDQQDKTAFRTIPVHFKDAEAVQAFADLIGQKITDKTRFCWYPEIEIETYADKRYAADET